MKFRIEIARQTVMNHPREQLLRMTDFIDERNPGMVADILESKDAVVYRGDAPPEVVTVIAAVARGDDLKAVLDALTGSSAVQ